MINCLAITKHSTNQKCDHVELNEIFDIKHQHVLFC